MPGRYGDDPAPALREFAEKALYNKGAHLSPLGRTEEAVEKWANALALPDYQADVCPWTQGQRP